MLEAMHPFIIFGAKYLVVLPILVVAYLLISLKASKRTELLLLLIVGGIFALLSSKLGSHFYSDPRPFVSDHAVPLLTSAHDNGFPSDHTLLSAFLAFVVLAFSRKLGAVLLLAALLIGTARVAAHVHHGVDVVGGFAGAALAFALAYALIPLLRSHEKPAIDAE
ncbi:MAG: phosphatase family protein [Candidatus Saccharibacteria bacterium]|nr:phosphatase family protein [Candidatus Saccharibacteria bacterium]